MNGIETSDAMAILGPTSQAVIRGKRAPQLKTQVCEIRNVKLCEEC